MSAGTYVTIAGTFVDCGRKGPHVLARGPASYTDSVDVILIDGDGGVELVCKESIWRRVLVSDDTPAHPRVAHAQRAEEGRGASGGGVAPPTGPYGGLYESEASRTALCSVAHVDISDPHPTPCIDEPFGHIAVHSLQSQPPPHPVVPRLGAGVIADNILTVEGRVCLRTTQTVRAQCCGPLGGCWWSLSGRWWSLSGCWW